METTVQTLLAKIGSLVVENDMLREKIDQLIAEHETSAVNEDDNSKDESSSKTTKSSGTERS